MERINEKGTIKINHTIFGRMLHEAIKLTDEHTFAASEKGKLLSGIRGNSPAPGEIGDNMVLEEEDGVIYVEFYIIMLFGASIRKYTKIILDCMEKKLKELFPCQPCRIVLNVVGVKSKQIAPRDIQVERKWG